MIGTPDTRATVTMPSVARMRGPRGPSGVMPTYSLALSAFNMPRNAAAPPLSLSDPGFAADPRTVPWPK